VRLPLMPLNAVLFPWMPMPLAIFEERYLRMVRECREADQLFGIALIRRGPEVGGIAEPYRIGTTARLVRTMPSEPGLQALVIGQERFRIESIEADGDLLRAEVTLLEFEQHDRLVSAELCQELGQMLSAHIGTVLKLMGMPALDLAVPEDPERLSYMIAAHLTASLEQRQELLEVATAAERLLHERELLREESEQYRELLAAFEVAEKTQPGTVSKNGLFSRN